jgi:hypothetical protein
MSGDIFALSKSNRALSVSQLHLLLHPTKEEEDDALRQSENIMCINVGGKRHWIMEKNFVNFPGTRLGKLVRAKNRLEILRHCDKYWPGEEINGKAAFPRSCKSIMQLVAFHFRTSRAARRLGSTRQIFCSPRGACASCTMDLHDRGNVALAPLQMSGCFMLALSNVSRYFMSLFRIFF